MAGRDRSAIAPAAITGATTSTGQSAIPRQGSGGYVEAASPIPDKGWLIVGWTAQVWADVEPASRVFASLTVGSVTGDATTGFYPRPDLPANAVGFICVLAAPSLAAAQLLGLEVPHLGLHIASLGRDRTIVAGELGTTCRRLLRAALPPGSDHPVLGLLPRHAYDGTDTVAALWPPVHVDFDAAIHVRPDGLALTGWLVDPASSVKALLVRGEGMAVATLDPERWVPIRRPDILEALGPRYGLDSDEVGFLAYAPGVLSAAGGKDLHLEVETRDGVIAYKPLRTLDRPSLGAIKQLLSVPRPPQARLEAAFTEVIGPIVEGLNKVRLARPRQFRETTYGSQPTAPVSSVIITLYGRLDFMEYQLALFSESPDPTIEILYVLDDPRLREQAERLAGSCWARFRLPFRLILLAENVGFAPANNVGLNAARGDYVCLLNSDVFPVGADGLSWVPALTVQLSRDPTIGVISPLLIYEDGTVQHEGMHFERVPGLPPDWAFPIHTRKGRPPKEEASATALHDVVAVTGACMVVRRDALLAIGGLDETYLIGDFEDADLCHQLRAAGKRCVVDTRWRLYHLERQSQGEAQPWRGNVTLYNAWQHHRRWPAHALAEA